MASALEKGDGNLQAKVAQPQQPVPVVTVSLITDKIVNLPMDHVGRVVALQSVDLQARVEGTLEQVKFQEGGAVKAGETLFVIEQNSYLSQVKADQARVAEANAALRKAEQYRKRLESVRKGGISKTELETARADEQQAQAALDVANATLSLSKLNLDYTTIKAPISGRIGIANITKGNLVGPNSDTLARIVQMDPVRVRYSVSESHVVSVQQELKRKGISADDLGKTKEVIIPRIRLSNGTMYDLPGKIEFAANEIDANTGTLPVYAIFDNPDFLLRPGQFVNVLITSSKPETKPVVPQAAVLEDVDGPYVFVVNQNNQVQPRHITIGVALETEWAVEEGLMAGETIVISGIQKIRPGMVVETVPSKTP
ncbi:efflux RND transporter periplasmic adaptor subunit [Desulfobacula toluolica]|nr:efflux RND transporter periplasmic adaptor subunit [Desulfobacula toluolica]